MKPIRFHRKFEKHYAKRVLPKPKLKKAYTERYAQFVLGVRGRPLDDHALGGNMAGKRAFSITGDMRVVYIETDEAITFLDVGTHAQVYAS